MKIVCTNKKPDGTECGYVWRSGVSHRCKYSLTRGTEASARPRKFRCGKCRAVLTGEPHTCEGG